MTTDAPDTIPNASAIIDCFGGIRPMSAKTGIPVTTIQGWKKRDAIPLMRLKEIKDAAQLHRVDLRGLLGGVDVTPTENAVKESIVVSVGNVPKTPEADADIAPPSHGKVIVAAAIVIFVAAAIGVVFAIAPEVHQLTAQEQRLRDMEQQLAEMKAQEAAAQPTDVQKQLASLQGKVNELTEQAAYYKNALQDLKTGTMPERITKLEGHVNHLLEQAHAYGLQSMLQNVMAMQASTQGAGQLSDVMTSLVEAGGAEGAQTPDQLSAAFEKLRQSDPKVAATFKDVAPEDMRAAVMLLGMAQLRSSLARDNSSFDQDLKILKMTAAKDDPALQAAIDRLAPKAKSGVLTPDGLSKQLRGLTGEIVSAELSGEDISIKDKALARFGEIVTVDKDGERVSGTDTQKKIADAQKLLDQGDVEGAVAILNQLQGPAAEKTKPLIDEAQATIAADQVQQLLGQNLLGRLQGISAKSTPYTAGGGIDDLLGPIKNMVPNNIQMPNSLKMKR